MNVSILREDLTILNVHAPDHTTSTYIREKLPVLKGEGDKPTMIA